MENYVFGIDVGGTTVKCGLFTTEGVVLDKWEIRTNKENGGASILGDIAASINAKLAEKKIDKSVVKGVGIGVPGPVKGDGTVLTCVNLGWGKFNVNEEMSKLVGLPVAAGNDANVAALGEMWKGGGQGYQDVVMITLGTGVGGGIILDGKMDDALWTSDVKANNIKFSAGDLADITLYASRNSRGIYYCDK